MLGFPLFSIAKNYAQLIELIILRFGEESFESWKEVQETKPYQTFKHRSKKDRSIKEYLKSKKPDIDPLLLDLLDNVLRLDPKERFSALEVLNHPYFNSPSGQEELSDDSRAFPKVEIDCHEFTVRKEMIKEKEIEKEKRQSKVESICLSKRSISNKTMPLLF